MRLSCLRGSFVALALAVAGWAGGCATMPHPMVDPGFAARAYTPSRIALLPPDVFVVLDQVGDNDPVQSAQLGQAVSVETVRAVEQALRARGYDVDLSAQWDGIHGQDGSLLVSREELGAFANGVVSFANSPDGGGNGPMAAPRLVAPELAARVGWATQSQAVLYVNVKGAVTTAGKRTASVLAAVFIVVIVVAIVLLLASQKGGHGNGGVPGSGSHGTPMARAPNGGGWRGAPAVPGGGGSWRGTPSSGFRAPTGTSGVPSAGAGWRGGRVPPPAPRGVPVYGGGGGVNVGIGVGVVVPIDQPVYTHDGSVAYDDPVFAGDELYVSMTLISTYDGRVLWHARDHLDLEANHPEDVDRLVHTFLDTLPPALPPSAQ